MSSMIQPREEGSGVYSLLRVGIVGLEPGRSWAARAHLPALRALPEMYEIAGVANTSLASAEKAAAATGLPRAFAGIEELVASPDVDVVAVTVKVSHHLEVARAALNAGKHVYCEWPLGNGLKEAEELAELASAKHVLGVVGTQACVSPQIAYLSTLIADDFVGEVLSTTLVANNVGWGWNGLNVGRRAYMLDRANGATLLTIPLGHALAAVREVLGDIAEVSAVLATRRTTAIPYDAARILPVSSPDEILVSGVLASGVPISIHYRDGEARDGDFLWQISGTNGSIRVSASLGHPQMVPLSLEGVRGDEKAFQPLELTAAYSSGFPEDVVPGNVARMYARMGRDVRDGSRTAASFNDAVTLHRIIAAIEESAESGRRTRVQSPSLKSQSGD